METSLVTGGAGFIGSWLCESLLEKGHRVVCVDNLVTGSEDNISHLEGREGFSFQNRDISEGLELDGPVDYVFHLASPASPDDFTRIPLKIMMVNSLGARNVLELAREKGSRVLMASTSEVYGDPEVHPQDEGYWGRVNPVGPRSCYDESKRFAEALAMAYIREHGMDIRLVRIFNTYGPRMRREDGRAVPNFMVQALEGKPLTVYGDGKQTRSFCFVSDLVDGIERFMFRDGLSGEIINLGNPDEYSILDLAERIRKLSGSGSEIRFQGLPKDDPRKRRPDISRAGKLLGWEPQTSLEDGLRQTLEFFEKDK